MSALFGGHLVISEFFYPSGVHIVKNGAGETVSTNALLAWVDVAPDILVRTFNRLDLVFLHPFKDLDTHL